VVDAQACRGAAHARHPQPLRRRLRGLRAQKRALLRELLMLADRLHVSALSSSGSRHAPLRRWHACRCAPHDIALHATCDCLTSEVGAQHCRQ
jgi:hypothetical protein